MLENTKLRVSGKKQTLKIKGLSEEAIPERSKEYRRHMCPPSLLCRTGLNQLGDIL